jgi:allophanate hydrolase subunit 1
MRRKKPLVHAPLWRIQPQGDRCLLLRFGDAIDARVGRVCLAAARLLREARLPGVTDIVPSFTVVAVHYRPGPGGPGHARLTHLIENALSQGIEPDETASREIEIPVCYGGEHGPDLAAVAARAGLSEDDIVARHARPGSMVFMLGFAPGLPYIGVHDAAREPASLLAPGDRIRFTPIDARTYQRLKSTPGRLERSPPPAGSI